jgi:hypothetical protein
MESSTQFWSRQHHHHHHHKLRDSLQQGLRGNEDSLFSVDVIWNGPDPKDTALCPYPVDFYGKPAPAESLNSLESGRLLLQVDLPVAADDVASVAGRLVNNAKQENLGKLDADASKIKRQTSVSTKFVQDTQHPNRWLGELSIPASWVEGSTRTHERTGAASPKSTSITTTAANLYTLEITYTLDNSNSCTARFWSEDAFHWQARSKSTM